MPRIRRVLASRSLECGCFVGVYETYAGAIVQVVEERGVRCAERAHRIGRVIPTLDRRSSTGATVTAGAA